MEEGGRCGGGAKMQVYERERGEISADSERGVSGAGKCELVGVERGWNTKQRSEYRCQNYHKAALNGGLTNLFLNRCHVMF